MPSVPQFPIRQKRVLLLAVAILLVVLPHPCLARQVEVVYVYDGDTIKVSRQGEESRVRLVGIDAPETSKGYGEPGQPYSQKARQHLNRLVLHRSVVIHEYGTDVYGRILAVVFLNGRNINLEMVRAGLAEADFVREGQDVDVKPYREAEQEAREAGCNMWSLGRRYVSPSEWRKIHR